MGRSVLPLCKISEPLPMLIELSPEWQQSFCGGATCQKGLAITPATPVRGDGFGGPKPTLGFSRSRGLGEGELPHAISGWEAV